MENYVLITVHEGTVYQIPPVKKHKVSFWTTQKFLEIYKILKIIKKTQNMYLFLFP